MSRGILNILNITVQEQGAYGSLNHLAAKIYGRAQSLGMRQLNELGMSSSPAINTVEGISTHNSHHVPPSNDPWLILPYRPQSTMDIS